MRGCMHILSWLLNPIPISSQSLQHQYQPAVPLSLPSSTDNELRLLMWNACCRFSQRSAFPTPVLPSGLKSNSFQTPESINATFKSDLRGDGVLAVRCIICNLHQQQLLDGMFTCITIPLSWSLFCMVVAAWETPQFGLQGLGQYLRDPPPRGTRYIASLSHGCLSPAP